MSKRRACSVCGQTQKRRQLGVHPDYSGATADSLGITLEFGTCPHCGTANVCPDCLHERDCCAAQEEKPGGQLPLFDGVAQ